MSSTFRTDLQGGPRRGLSAVGGGVLILFGVVSEVPAQQFVENTTDIPTGGAANNSFTEHVAFADVDLDGDWDAAFADGGTAGNDRNRLWVNQGAAQGGVVGSFVDRTTTQFPPVQDDSRDLDFVDFEGDGDLDLYVSNSSAVSNQTSRFWVNLGGEQGGSAGFFQDETASRWIHVGDNNGSTTHSSVAPSHALSSGGFIDWCCHAAFADLDDDGDLDLIHSSYGSTSLIGQVPTRVFLNDGGGAFEEFNPSGFQLSGRDILDGSPGLWCEGTHQQKSQDSTGLFCDIADVAIALDVGDLDGDFDLDFVRGEKLDEPRVFQNRTMENGGVLSLRDVSFAVLPPDWAPGIGHYEQELADLDNDGDLDIYGLNWNNICDSVFFNQGDGTFGAPVPVAGTCNRNNEADLFDADGDGDLDAFTVSDTDQETLFVNQGAGGGFAFVLDPLALPRDTTSTVAAEACDVDEDGDYDVFVANDLGAANIYLENVSQVADTTAPRLPLLEDAPDRVASGVPTRVRVHVVDAAPWAIVATYPVRLEVTVDGGFPFEVPMVWSGGQVFRGEIPGALVGLVRYRAVASDEHGNLGASVEHGFTATGACGGAPTVYCTAKVNSDGCTPSIGASGTPSLFSGVGFPITCDSVRPGKSGLLFYGYAAAAIPFQGGFLCVQPPTRRTPPQPAAGAGPCGGSYAFDWNAYLATGNDPALVVGVTVWCQWWMRDPQSPSGTGLSDGLRFSICP